MKDCKRHCHFRDGEVEQTLFPERLSYEIIVGLGSFFFSFFLDIHDEVMEEQPWSWNDWNLSDTLGKIVLNSNEEMMEDPNRPSGEDYTDDTGRPFFYHAKRSSPSGSRRRIATPVRPGPQLDEPHDDDNEATTSTPTMTDTDDVAVLVEPRVLPLLGSHAAVAKLTRQKEAVLKKLLRQAGQLELFN